MKADSSRGWKTYENGLVAMMFFTFGIVFLDRFSVNFLFPVFAKPLHLTDANLGQLAAVLSVCFGLSGWVFGIVSDFTGLKKKLLVPVTAIFSICSILSGLASSFGALLLIRGFMGVLEGPVFPIGQSAIAKESTPRRRGFNMGFAQSAVGLIGATITPILVTAVAAAAGWRVSFYIVAIPGIIMSVILLRYMKDPFRKDPAKPQVEPIRANKADYMLMFKQRNIILAMLMTALFMGWLVVFTTFAPVYLVGADHFTVVDMGYIMSGIGLGSFLWGFIVPWISDRIGRRNALIIFGFLCSLSPAAFAVFHPGIVMMFIMGMLTAVGQGCIPLIGNIVTSESVPAHLVSSVVSLTQLVGELIGGTTLPLVAGVIADRYGLSAPLWLAVGTTLVAAVIAIWLKETAPRKVQKLVPGEIGIVEFNSSL